MTVKESKEKKPNGEKLVRFQRELLCWPSLCLTLISSFKKSISTWLNAVLLKFVNYNSKHLWAQIIEEEK